MPTLVQRRRANVKRRNVAASRPTSRESSALAITITVVDALTVVRMICIPATTIR